MFMFIFMTLTLTLKDTTITDKNRTSLKFEN